MAYVKASRNLLDVMRKDEEEDARSRESDSYKDTLQAWHK